MDSTPSWAEHPTPLHAITRFTRVDPATQHGADDEWLISLRAVASLFAQRPGCEVVSVGRAADDPTCWVLTSEWESVGAYRHALSSYEVKVHAVPLLSQAIDDPGAFEILYSTRGGHESESSSARADG